MVQCTALLFLLRRERQRVYARRWGSASLRFALGSLAEDDGPEACYLRQCAAVVVSLESKW